MIIKIDATNCNSVVQGYSQFNNGMQDYWNYSNHIFETGKSYGLVSEYMQGCMFLSYLLGGKIEIKDGLNIYVDDKKVSSKELSDLSWNIEPYYEKYKNKIVKKSICKALEKSVIQESFEQIAETFLLSKARYDRKLYQLSGERWRASTALGYALNKKIFFAPYMPSNQYKHMNGLIDIIRFLTNNNRLVVLPVGSDKFIKNCVDNCIYIK